MKGSGEHSACCKAGRIWEEEGDRGGKRRKGEEVASVCEGMHVEGAMVKSGVWAKS